MVETYEPVPFEKRPSQNIGLGHYAHELAPLVGLATLGGIVGWMAGKLKLTGQTPGFSAALGAKITGVVSAFLIWRKHETKNVGIEEVYKEIKTIDAMHLTNDDLTRDNRVLTQMIDFEKRKSFAERVTPHASTPQSPAR